MLVVGGRSFLPALLLAACTGVSLRPGTVTPDSLPQRLLSAAEQERLADLVEQAVREVVLRRYEAAERAAAAALEIDPRSSRARAVRGIVLLQAANEIDPPDIFLANEGESETILAEQLAPADPFVGWVRALFLAESGHLSAAAAAAEAAIERSRGSPPEERAPLFGLAGTYRYELGEERAALPMLEAYVGLRPDDATASFRIGSCLLRMSMLPTGAPGREDEIAQGQAERAARAFARCVELAPGDEDAALAIGAATLRAAALAGTRGAAADRARLLAGVVEQLGGVAERFPDSAEAPFRIGIAEEERGDGVAAAAAYERALQRDGDHLGSLLNLAALLAEGGDAEAVRARELLQRALLVGAGTGRLTADEQRRIRDHLAAR